jgi:predicted Rossmann fold nucleotide-binding protein DprA/Smf involved in DNA uptake
MQYQSQQAELCGRRTAALGAIDFVHCRKLALLCCGRCPGDVILKAYDFARLVRGSGVAIVSGFHSPIEKDCLSILLRDSSPIIIVQAHRLSTTRLLERWQKAIDAGHLLILSPFSEKEKRVTIELAAEGNRFLGAMSDEVLIPYAAPGSKTEILQQQRLCREAQPPLLSRG